MVCVDAMISREEALCYIDGILSEPMKRVSSEEICCVFMIIAPDKSCWLGIRFDDGFGYTSRIGYRAHIITGIKGVDDEGVIIYRLKGVGEDSLDYREKADEDGILDGYVERVKKIKHFVVVNGGMRG